MELNELSAMPFPNKKIEKETLRINIHIQTDIEIPADCMIRITKEIGIGGFEYLQIMVADKDYYYSMMGFPMVGRKHLIKDVYILPHSIEVNYMIVRPT